MEDRQNPNAQNYWNSLSGEEQAKLMSTWSQESISETLVKLHEIGRLHEIIQEILLEKIQSLEETIQEKNAKIKHQEHIIAAHQTSNLNRRYLKNVHEECTLCRHITNRFGHNLASNSSDLPKALHSVMRTREGHEIVVVHTCPHIRNMNMEEKNSFLKAVGFCRACVIKPIGPKHHEETCKSGKKDRYKCKEATCNHHYLVCNTHKHLNTFKIRHKQEELKQDGVSCKF